MPHTQRKLGESGFYHIVAKGDGAQIIFESDKDRIRYLDTLEQAVHEHGIRLHAYCLMDNHVHLLAQDEKREISAFMKQLSETYAMYSAKVTGRVGRVFQRPFWSEPIETDSHFLCTIRYIHANPESAGICKTQDYPWSSYRAHLSESSFVEVGFARAMLGDVRRFEAFSTSGGCYAKPFKGSKLRRHHSHDELVNIAITLIGRETLNGMKALSPSARQPLIALLREHGFSGSEIARITGLGDNAVRRCLTNVSS